MNSGSLNLATKTFGLLGAFLLAVFLGASANTTQAATDFGVPTSEYAVSEFVYNDTGDNWIGYQVKLSFGTGASFVSAGLGTGLGFDTPDYDSPMDFSPYPVGSFDDVTITAGGATVVPGSNMLFQFAFDVPSGITEFTLRQEPRVEPVSDETETCGSVKQWFR